MNVRLALLPSRLPQRAWLAVPRAGCGSWRMLLASAICGCPPCSVCSSPGLHAGWWTHQRRHERNATEQPLSASTAGAWLQLSLAQAATRYVRSAMPLRTLTDVACLLSKAATSMFIFCGTSFVPLNLLWIICLQLQTTCMLHLLSNTHTCSACTRKHVTLLHTSCWLMRTRPEKASPVAPLACTARHCRKTDQRLLLPLCHHQRTRPSLLPFHSGCLLLHALALLAVPALGPVHSLVALRAVPHLWEEGRVRGRCQAAVGSQLQ